MHWVSWANLVCQLAEQAARLKKWLNMIYMEKHILIVTALIIEYPLLHIILSALCIPQIDRGVSRGLLNSLLCDNIKSTRVKEVGKLEGDSKYI